MSSFLYRSSARRKLFNQFQPVKNEQEITEILGNGGKALKPVNKFSVERIFAIVFVIVVIVVTLLILLS